MDHSNYVYLFYLNNPIDLVKAFEKLSVCFKKHGLLSRLSRKGGIFLFGEVSGWISFHFRIKNKFDDPTPTFEISFELYNSDIRKLNTTNTEKITALSKDVVALLDKNLISMVGGNFSTCVEYFEKKQAIGDVNSVPFVDDINFVKFDFDSYFVSNKLIAAIGENIFDTVPAYNVEKFSNGLLIINNNSLGRGGSYPASNYFSKIVNL